MHGRKGARDCRLFVIDKIHRDLNQAASLQFKAERLHETQASIAFTDRAGDASRQARHGAIEPLGRDGLDRKTDALSFATIDPRAREHHARGAPEAVRLARQVRAEIQAALEALEQLMCDSRMQVQ